MGLAKFEVFTGQSDGGVGRTVAFPSPWHSRVNFKDVSMKGRAEPQKRGQACRPLSQEHNWDPLTYPGGRAS